MFDLIKAEIKKNFKLGFIITWVLCVLFSTLTVRVFSLEDSYADVFSKFMGLIPLLGLLMFMLFSKAFVLEYNSNMDGLIKATKNGKKRLVEAKFIAAGISAAIVNLSMFYAMIIKIFSALNFAKMNMPINKLWCFEGVTSNITVMQLMILMTITLIFGSFFMAAVGLCLSSISSNAIVPFLVGGVIMAVPYMLALRGTVVKPSIINLHLFGMYSSYMVDANASLIMWGTYFISTVVEIAVFYIFAKKNFLKER